MSPLQTLLLTAMNENHAAKPTEKQLRLAAKIYGLALLAQTDAGSNRPYENEVRGCMNRAAWRALNHLNIHPGDVLDEATALRFAQAIIA
jgi:heme O synthase-like polyprenyltransferase